MCVSVWAYHAQHMSNTFFLQVYVISMNSGPLPQPAWDGINYGNQHRRTPARNNKVFVPVEMVSWLDSGPGEKASVPKRNRTNFEFEETQKKNLKTLNLRRRTFRMMFKALFFHRPSRLSNELFKDDQSIEQEEETDNKDCVSRRRHQK